MSTQPQTPKEKYTALLKEIRTQKSLPVLEKIYEDLKQNKEHLYDDTVVPFQFSDDFIWFLKYNLISIQYQMDIFKLYIEEFFTLKCKPENLSKIKFIYDIFTYESNFYSKASNTDNFLIFLNRFFNLYYPKDISIIHKEGDYMDVLISEERDKLTLNGWIQLKIKRIDEEKKLYIFNDYKDKENKKEIMIAFDNFKSQERNTYVKEEEMTWRDNLKAGDKIDYLSDNNNWIEATVKEILSESEIGIGTTEQDKKIYIMNKYSPFIQPYLKYSYKYQEDESICISLLEENLDFQRFNYLVPCTEKNHLIPYDNFKFYSLEYYEILNFFINKVLETKILLNESLSIEYIYVILNVFNSAHYLINHKFIGTYIKVHVYENVRKILINFSLDKKMNKSKFMFENIIVYFDKFFGYIQYPFQMMKFFPEFIIEFGYNCFKNSESLEKRLLGLNSILKILPILNKFFPLISNDVITKLTSLISEKLLGGDTDKDLFGLLFIDPNIHEQLLLKGVEIVISLTKMKFLDDKDIERLYNLALSAAQDSDIYKSLYDLLNKITNDIELSQLKVLFDKIISFPYDKIRETDITLMSNVIQNIKIDNEFKVMTKTFLDYYYNYMIDFKKKDETCGVTFSNILSYAKDEENAIYLYSHYFERGINDLNSQNDLEGYRFYFTFIYNLIVSLEKRSDRDKGCLPFLRKKFSEIFFEKNKNLEIIADKMLLLNEKEVKENKITDMEGEKAITDIIDIINKFTNFANKKGFFNIDSLKKLSEYYVFCDIFRKSRSQFLFRISELNKEESEEFLDYFFNRFDKFLDTINNEHPERYGLLDNYIVMKIHYFYKNINYTKEKDLLGDYDVDTYLNYLANKYQQKLNPLKFKYFDIVWKTFIKFDDFNEVKRFIEIFSLKNFTPEERHEIWESLVQKIFKGIDNNILLSLKMLDFIITISETYGNGGTKSHLLDTKKKKPVKLTFNNVFTLENIIFEFSEENNEIIYSTDTVSDLKSKIQKKYGIDPIFFDITHSKGPTFSTNSTANAMPLFKLVPKIEQDDKGKEDIIVLIRKGKIFGLCPFYPYKEGNEPTPKFVQILQELFIKHADNNKIELSKFKFMFPLLFNLGKIKVEQYTEEIVKTYNKLDLEKKGFLTNEDFVELMVTVGRDRKDFMSTFLHNYGYGPNLDNYMYPLSEDSPLYYKKNTVKEYMPRYFIGNNQEYMSKLFTYAKYNNKQILEAAQHLLQEVCTMEQLKKTIFEKSNKIEEVISNPNLELRGYAFDILLNEFEKDDKDENDINLVNNFINNNLKKIIVELDKFSNVDENIKDKKDDEKRNIIRYFNFYFTNLKIIFYTFKNILGNNDIINYIDKFDDLNDENEKNNIKNVKFELSKEKQDLIKSLQLETLVNALGKNTTIIGEKKEQNYRKAMTLSVKILIYIIFFSKDLSEKEKTEMYNSYINLEITLSQSSNFYVKRLFFTANKLLLYFLNNETDKKYILTKYDIISKEVLDYKKLNDLEGKLTIFFKMFIDIFQLGINGLQNDKIFSLYENLMKLILDKNVELGEYLLTGYLNIVREILTILKNKKYNKLYEYDFEPLIKQIINEFIITFDRDENDKIIEINNLKNYSRYSDTDYVSYIFQILNLIILLNPEKYLKIFFLNDDIKNVREKHLTKLESSITGYNPNHDSRSSHSHVGLKNLSSICYMNSVLQQFFMIPLFRYSILSLPLPENLEEEKEDNDNLLFQLIRMFYYLNYSDQGYYNPKNFVFSFKDYDGNPTKINIQCDAQEFLSRFIEKVEDCLKNNKQKYLCNNIFGGSTLQQVICTNPDCGNISERKENINFLSLDIKNVKNVEECLDKFILEEKIEDYHCEKCDKKITNIKHVVIDKIPNILIIHLQRIAFSYETFNMEKINSYITFEKSLNIKKYTSNKDNENIPLEYFDYDLQGVLIHSGTAQYGHYYSLISPEENEIKEKWFKFNDSSVTKIDYDNIISDAFGNNSDHQYGSSAYMLIYQKTVKKPVVVNTKELEENVKKILEEKKEEKLDSIDIDKDKMYLIYDNAKDAVEKNTDVYKLKYEEDNINKNIIIKNDSVEANLISYKEALSSLIEENNIDKEKKPFLKNILLENIKICNDKKFFTRAFTKFIKDEIEIIKEIITKDKNEEKLKEYIPIYEAINDYILFVFPFCSQFDGIKTIVDDMINLCKKLIPKEFISHIIKDIIEPNKDNFYDNYFISRDNKKGNCVSIYIGNLLALSMDNNIETELVTKIIEFYFDKIPVQITKNWLDMEAFNNLILSLIENSNIIKKSFINNSMISKLIDLIMGKESPLYQGDERVEQKNNKPKFGPIVKAIAILFKYYIDNYQKEELKLSKGDIIMIDCIKFYEKVVVEDYDSDASNMLIDYKMNLIMILNKEENKEEFDKEIIGILIKLKIPSIVKKEEIISGLNLITHIIEKYVEIYKINDNNEQNNEKFLEKLNILLGIPAPAVTGGDAEIKYISGRYADKYTILSNIYSQKERNKEALPLLNAIFNLFNINKTVFDYIDKLPAPNSFKYSFVDYCIKLYLLFHKETEAESEVRDEMELDNPYKKFDSFVNEICKKYNKDINIIKNNDIIDIDNLLYFPEFFFEKIDNKNLPQKINLFNLKLFYTTGKNVEKTNLGCFNHVNYFSNILGKKGDENLKLNAENGIYTIQCIVICAKEDLNLKITFKPYFISKIEIEAKKDYHYFIYCTDITDKNKENKDEENKMINIDNLKVEIEERLILALPQGNENAGSDEGCAINCPVCGSVNILDERNQDFKCLYCESPLF